MTKKYIRVASKCSHVSLYWHNLSDGWYIDYKGSGYCHNCLRKQSPNGKLPYDARKE